LISTTDSLYVTAADLLEAAADCLQWGDRRKVVTVGTPAYDCCPQLAVWTSRIEEGNIGPTAPASGDSMVRIGHGLGRIIQVTLQIEVVGCVPVAAENRGQFTPPGQQAITDSSAEIYAWGWALRCGLAQQMRDGDLFGGDCQFKDLGIAQPITPEGGCAGWILPVVVQLDGYDPL
jgi:hypothetical protein